MLRHRSALAATASFSLRLLKISLLVTVAWPGLATAVYARQKVEDQYVKSEVRIPMRDGTKLFTAIYAPRDATPTHTYPILMHRTCYSVRPYGPDQYRSTLGPNRYLQESGFIFVYQDVRGCYLSEGTFRNMTPHVDDKKTDRDVDESSDTYDTIAWLLKHVKHSNGRVGQWGISYPGFYSAAGMIDAHPALKAVSPQAPIADWWYDDFHHHGAFFLPHAFNFLTRFGPPRPHPTTYSNPRFDHGTPDGYQFFMDLGSLVQANKLYMRDRNEMWEHLVAHPNYDEYWKARNLLPHLKHVAPAVLIVGGWFDAEDLYGPLNIYRQIEHNESGVDNRIVMGPWSHGGWARTSGDHLGNIAFDGKTSEYFQTRIETPFFTSYLKGRGEPTLAEASMFETGTNRWRHFDQWPPKDLEARKYYFAEQGRLSLERPNSDTLVFDQFTSDPRRPVPFIEDTDIGMTRPYMTDDQRFASRRPDVLVYQTEPLRDAITVCGPLIAQLDVSTSQSDADWVVKLIDVLPPTTPDNEFTRAGKHLGNYQMMVRSEVIRGRFRNDPSRPERFVSNKPTHVTLPLQDVLHTFEPGHRIMVQVQSTWFPLVDRNPQKYIDNIFRADAADFVSAVHRVYRSGKSASHIELNLLKQ